MGTRGAFTFIDADKQTFHVYKHHDCYPEGPWGGPAVLLAATRYAWQFPRFEADEFAAAFITAAKLSTAMTLHMQKLFDQMDARAALGKDDPDGNNDVEVPIMMTVPPTYRSLGGGGVRLLPKGTWERVIPWDCAYQYVVRQMPGHGDTPIIATSYSLGGGDDKRTREELFSGTIMEMAAWGLRLHEEQEAAQAAADEAARAPKFRLRPARKLL